MKNEESPATFDWNAFRDHWTFPPGTIYLNHGSFGPAPRSVLQERQRWFLELEHQPMNFLVRRLEGLLDEAATQLAQHLGCDMRQLAFVPNATTGMNVVANQIDLKPDDEVLLNDHEYGAVHRIWQQRCERASARVVVAELTPPWESTDHFVQQLFRWVTARTRCIVISHVTSQTATRFPVEAICREATKRNIPVCIDGPHAIASVALDLNAIGCDYYVASCHKWLCAPLGSGFLYQRDSARALRPTVTSWGRSLSGRPSDWRDEFHWPGTFDPSGYLSIPTALGFLEAVGWDRFRAQTRALAALAREKLLSVTGGVALTPAADAWSISMVTITLPSLRRSETWPGQPHPLQRFLWEKHRIEAPVFEWRGQLCIRASCHLYNHPDDVEHLAAAVHEYQRHTSV